jgi:hypothetical protein
MLSRWEKSRGNTGERDEGELDQAGSMTRIPENLSQNSGLSLGERDALRALFPDENTRMKPNTTSKIEKRRVMWNIRGASRGSKNIPQL